MGESASPPPYLVVVLAGHALADSALHETGQRRQHVDRRVDLTVLQLPVDVDLALRDVPAPPGRAPSASVRAILPRARPLRALLPRNPRRRPAACPSLFRARPFLSVGPAQACPLPSLRCMHASDELCLPKCRLRQVSASRVVGIRPAASKCAAMTYYACPLSQLESEGGLTLSDQGWDA